MGLDDGERTLLMGLGSKERMKSKRVCGLIRIRAWWEAVCLVALPIETKGGCVVESSSRRCL